MLFHFRLITDKLDSINSQKLQEYRFSPIFHKIGWIKIFFEHRASSTLTSYKILTSCKKSEKTNEPFLRKTEQGRGNS